MDDTLPVYLPESTPEKLQPVLQKIPASQSLLVLVAEGGEPNLELINQTLFLSGYHYAGAVFPKLIFGNEVLDTGLIIVPLTLASPPVTIHGLNNGIYNLHDLPDIAALRGHTLLILVDGLAQHTADFLRRLYSHFGTQVVYLGAGAGSMTMQQTPCILSTSGLAQGEAILIPIAGRIKLGVKHGWQRLMGPLIATEVEKNTIKQINWQPAFTVYRDMIENDLERKITKNNFSDIASAFPFGLEKEDAEDIVRDPMRVTDDGALECVSEVPENALIHILKGEAEVLTSSAQQAAQMSTQQNEHALSFTLIIDCISRFLYLDDKFTDELERINHVFDTHGRNTTTFGVLTLGEISSMGDGFLEFLNKSVVIGTQDSSKDQT